MWTQVLLSGRADDQKMRKGLEAITRATQSESQMVNDLLDVSRIEAGKMRFDVRTVDLPSVIEAAADIVRPSLDAKNIRLQLLLDPNRMATGRGRPGTSPAGLLELAAPMPSNSLPRKAASKSNSSCINSHVELVTVAGDNGRGIDATALPRIFEPFWQEEGGPSRSETGLGLGLSIVRKIVEMHGGSVLANSGGPGLGSTFTVIMPVSIAHQS